MLGAGGVSVSSLQKARVDAQPGTQRLSEAPTIPFEYFHTHISGVPQDPALLQRTGT